VTYFLKAKQFAGFVYMYTKKEVDALGSPELGKLD